MLLLMFGNRFRCRYFLDKLIREIVAMLYLVKMRNSHSGEPTLIIGVFPDEEFAKAYIAELNQAAIQIEDLSTNSPHYRNLDASAEESEEYFWSVIEPNASKILEKVKGLLKKHCSRDTWAEVSQNIDTFNDVTAWFSRLESFYIDEIELASPIYEVREHFGKFIR